MTQFIRKIGEPRAETITVNLTEDERAEQGRRALEYRAQQKALAIERSTTLAGFTQRKKDLEAKEEVCSQRSTTGTDQVAVLVQDVLTAGNEVLSMQLDAEGNITSKIAAKRTATGEELQEELFGGTDEDKPH
jgi:hypothetical protein